MKNFNISNYALMLENRAFIVEAAPEKKADEKAPDQKTKTEMTKQVAKSLIQPQEGDSAAIKEIAEIVNNASKHKAQYDSIIAQIEPFIFNTDESMTTMDLTFKSIDGKVDYSVKVNRSKDPHGNFAVWFDEDGTKVFIEGLDVNYLAAQFNKAIAGLGTDEELIGSLAGGIYKASYAANANPKEVFKAVAARYQEAFGEEFYAAIDGEFSGSPDVFAHAVLGKDVTESDISTALGVDFLQSLALDVAIGVATFGAGAAIRGVMTGARLVNAAKAVNGFRGGMTAFRAGLAGERTGVGISGAANVASLAKGAQNFNQARSGFSAITAAGNAAGTAGKIGAGVGAGAALAGAPYSGAEQTQSNITAEDAAFAFASQIRDLAKGYTDGASELQIAFMVLSLDPKSAQLVLAQWSKNYGDEGTFYNYCISEELSGDLKTLVDGYWAGIANEGPLAGRAQTIANSLSKGAAAPTEQTPPATEETES